MSFQGQFTPGSGNPQPAVGTDYTHGMWWLAAAAGTINSQSFAAGDRIYASGEGVMVEGAVTWAVRTSTTIAELLDQSPLPHDGVAVGVDDWRFVVDLALPSDAASVVGVGTVGAATVGTFDWFDITGSVRGAEWGRGSDEPHGRPRVGELFLTLDARDGLSPIDSSASAFYGPGTVVRVSVVNPTRAQEWGTSPPPWSWLAQYTGLVESWPLTTYGQSADSEVTITAYETLRDLSEVDGNALPSTVGSGDDAETRVNRLLDAANWRYGSVRTNQVLSVIKVRSTDMAERRLTELYLTADSTDNRFRSGRDGRPVLHSIEGSSGDDDNETFPLVALSNAEYASGSDSRAFIGFDWSEHRETGTSIDYFNFTDAHFVPYDADTLVMANDAAYVINDCRFAIVGGTQQVAEHADSIARYGRRSFARYDLISLSDSYAESLAGLVVNRQARNTLRVEELTVSTVDRGTDVFETMVAADVGVSAIAYPPADNTDLDRPRVLGVLSGFRHRVTPRGDQAVTWSTTVRLDTWQVGGVPAANLPSA